MFTKPFCKRTTRIGIIIVPGSKAKGNKEEVVHKPNSPLSSEGEEENLNSATSMTKVAAANLLFNLMRLSFRNYLDSSLLGQCCFHSSGYEMSETFGNP
jgi:hypothetical protein